MHQVGCSQQAIGAAGLTIFKAMIDPDVPAAVRLRTAGWAFDHAIKGIELEFESRFSEFGTA
jgi:hypothetical protein